MVWIKHENYLFNSEHITYIEQQENILFIFIEGKLHACKYKTKKEATKKLFSIIEARFFVDITPDDYYNYDNNNMKKEKGGI